MKKLIVFVFAMVAVCTGFYACDDSKTYAEMLEEEKDAVNAFLKAEGITVISKEEFELDTVTRLDLNQYVVFSNGVYMQIVDRGSTNPADTFANNNEVCVRYLERNITTGDTTCLNIFIENYDSPWLYNDPAVFRYVSSGTTVYGTFTQMDYAWNSYYATTSVPAGWLLALPYLRDMSSVRLIVPSKMGHSSAQQSVVPYFYDIRRFQKY
jgi:hypothetical protein